MLPSSRALCWRVGPLAWVLLEELALQAEARPEGLAVETNVRDLGATLNVGKDTVARALGRLADLGLVYPQTRRVAGRYAGCVYVLDIEACRRAGIVIAQVAVASPRRPVVPCPVTPDAAEGDAAGPTATGTAGASPASQSAGRTDSTSPSLFELSDFPPTPDSHPLAATPDPSSTPSHPNERPDFPTPVSPSPTRSAPGVRQPGAGSR